MPNRECVLTDVAEQVWLEDFHLREEPELRLPGSSAWSITKRTLRGGRSDGVDSIEINNGALSVAVLPTRGMGLWRGRYTPPGSSETLDLGWKSPVLLPVNPAFVDLRDRNELGWLNGFNELLCRCGLESNGPPCGDSGNSLTLHGKIANIPAHRVTVQIDTQGKGTLSVTGVVDESSMFGSCLRLTSTLSTEAGSNRLRIVDRVTNLAESPAELALLYHINVGRPFLEADSRFAAPIRELAPRDARAAEGIGDWSSYLGPTTGYAEQVYFMELAGDASGDTLALLTNSSGDKGLSVHFNRSQLPCFSLWKNTQAEADGFVTGLEPATNFPNAKPYEREQGRIVPLAAGESHEMAFEMAVHPSAEAVNEVEQEIAALQGDTAPEIHSQPLDRFSPN